MNSRQSFKTELLQQLETAIDGYLPQSTLLDESGRVARSKLLSIILEFLPQFPTELRPPALRRGDYYREIALAIVESADPSFLQNERVRFSLYRIIRFARTSRETLVQSAVDSHPDGNSNLESFSRNLAMMVDLPDAIIPPP